VRRAGHRLDAAPGDLAAAREAEAALLTDPQMRLCADGTFGLGARRRSPSGSAS